MKHKGDNELLTNIIDNMKSTEIEQSSVHGMGLFASTIIKKGYCLGELDGQFISWSQYKVLKETYKTENNCVFIEWNAIEKELLLVRALRTKYSFINHSRTPNLVIKYNPIRIESLEDITVGEELFLDYRKEELNEEYLRNHGSTYL